MKLAHIILAHSKPLQLRRLIDSLQDESVKSFVHLDAKCNADEYDLPNEQGLEMITPRFDVSWGGFSQVMAIVSSIRCVLNSGEVYDYINLISGQDYPLKPVSAFKAFLEKNAGKIFMEFHLPGHAWVKEAIQRISKYHFTDFKFKGRYLLERIINTLIPARKIPKDFTIIGHSTWFTIDWESALYVVKFFDENPSFIRRFNYTWGADELLIQSVLFNSHLRSKIVNDNLRYIDWSEGKASPRILTMADAKNLRDTNCFFGRKFDMEIDQDIVDYLDTQALKVI
ncbi:beta-1,6-N-acetylglucosaminyltransferase [Pedobacter frigoris]|uniref:Peptide O-xylosyltransferase n=1 Tax=Pedobacter frigoris TaxID=2571272 RepID=A0A4U1CN31_9SPHI|nr:beta-1,6-N-acetylglucosaminyltransferase [Pedobacter frigoris]TKC09327.1 glycosyl transferase [Pedobacter frigoris]